MDLPPIVELEALIIPAESGFVADGLRRILVSISLLPSSLTIHTIDVVNGGDTLIYSAVDERGAKYEFRHGGTSTGLAGSPGEALTHLTRPDDHRPKELTVSWRSFSGAASEIGTFVVPPSE